MIPDIAGCRNSGASRLEPLEFLVNQAGTTVNSSLLKGMRIERLKIESENQETPKLWAVLWVISHALIKRRLTTAKPIECSVKSGLDIHSQSVSSAITSRSELIALNCNARIASSLRSIRSATSLWLMPIPNRSIKTSR